MEEEERFESQFGEKYNDMPKMEPISAAAKMQYLAAGMIKLVPDIFHSNDCNIQFDTWREQSGDMSSTFLNKL